MKGMFQCVVYNLLFLTMAITMLNFWGSASQKRVQYSDFDWEKSAATAARFDARRNKYETEQQSLNKNKGSARQPMPETQTTPRVPLQPAKIDKEPKRTSSPNLKQPDKVAAATDPKNDPKNDTKIVRENIQVLQEKVSDSNLPAENYSTSGTLTIKKKKEKEDEKTQKKKSNNASDADVESVVVETRTGSDDNLTLLMIDPKSQFVITDLSMPDLKFPPFDNATINPFLPSYKVNNLTMFNQEIPLNYSITADVRSTKAWSNVTTLAFYRPAYLYSGFRNQMMVFTMLILHGIKEGHGQLLLNSVSQRDTFGSNKRIPFKRLWDVAHWNSFYPQLPRLVEYDPILHSQFMNRSLSWYRTPEGWFGTYGIFATEKPRRPYGYGIQHKLFGAYTSYAKGKGKYAVDGHRNPAEILMMTDAMRPHPDLQEIIDGLLQSLIIGNTSNNENEPIEYITLHARVEPDMQRQLTCRDIKVLNLTDIFRFVEEKWTDPPARRVFMPINRQYLEEEGVVNQKNPSKTNWIAVENLKALNHAREHGLWGGRAVVFEFGANALKGTKYEDRPSTTGAMVNFFLAINSKIFIGSEVSSYAHDLLAVRFFKNVTENYKYVPGGLKDWTPPGTIDPPGFHC